MKLTLTALAIFLLTGCNDEQTNIEARAKVADACKKLGGKERVTYPWEFRCVLPDGREMVERP